MDLKIEFAVRSDLHGGELDIFDQEPPTPKAAAKPIIALFSLNAMSRGAK